MSRLPIRVRITLAFTAAIALVLGGFGALVYLRTQAQLDEAIDDTLELRTADVATLVPSGTGGSELGLQDLDPEDSFAQILGLDGTIEFTTSQLDDPVLTPAEVDALDDDSLTLERDELEGIDGRVRLSATPLPGRRARRRRRTDPGGPRRVSAKPCPGPPDRRSGGAASCRARGLLGRRQSAGSSRDHALGSSQNRGHDPDARLAVPPADDELRRLALTLNEMLGRLEEAIERERRFVDDASHELRTPLALHKTELEVAQRYAESEEELRTAIASGIVEVDRLARLADDLLLVARTSESGPPLRKESIDAGALLETVAARVRAHADEPGCEPLRRGRRHGSSSKAIWLGWSRRSRTWRTTRSATAAEG